jgi:dTDP-N-acetylfucosamine:lipid II N-acetylfucosaminyltransferase
MNLHISAPSVFIDAFYENLVKLNLEKNNKIILRSDKPHDQFQSARFDSNAFNRIVGDTKQYKQVFIHQFSPIMYQWVAQNEFNELSWMIWGADLYNLPDLENQFYEPLTRQYVNMGWSTSDFLYKAKLTLTQARYKNAAYSKVDHILTWMGGEFSFAKKVLPLLKADHRFFFYENPTPYQQLAQLKQTDSKKDNHEIPIYIVGNSGSKTNNHLDLFAFLNHHSIKAKLIVPVSYGDKKYVSYLKKNVTRYTQGSIEFVDKFMPFEEYLSLLQTADGLIMNTLRPQGYGNIFMMIWMGKAVYMNSKNASRDDLAAKGIHCYTIEDLLNPVGVGPPGLANREAVESLLSHKKLITHYMELFS